MNKRDDNLYQLEWAGVKPEVPTIVFGCSIDYRREQHRHETLPCWFAGASPADIAGFAKFFPKRSIKLDGAPYLDRFALHGWLPGSDRQEFAANVYLHHFFSPDRARHLHNHPWPWAESRILTGGYLERRKVISKYDPEQQRFIRSAGDVVRLYDHTYHSIDELDGDVWTLFVTAGDADPCPRKGWGFYVPEMGGHVPHSTYEQLVGFGGSK